MLASSSSVRSVGSPTYLGLVKIATPVGFVRFPSSLSVRSSALGSCHCLNFECGILVAK